LIQISHLFVSYRGTKGSEKVEAVINASLQIRKGKITALVGESGSGKSTLLMAILSLLPAGTEVYGSITLDGLEISSLKEEQLNRIRWEKVALIPQGAMNSLTPVLSIGTHIMEVLGVHLGMKGTEAKERTRDLLHRAGLPSSVFRRFPHELSGGQKQRVAIAMALACNPRFLLADEPTTALDVITQGEIISSLSEIVRESGMGMLMVTHDLPLATAVADTISVMKDGVIVEQGPTENILRAPSAPHTKELIMSLKELEREEN
jgi:ABC-type glutathione transport system ATPase component